MVVAQRISGQYGEKQVVKQVSLEVQAGEFVGIIGPNGCGKSTVLKMLSGYHPHQTGKVLINQKELMTYTNKERAQQLAVMNQQQVLDIALRVEEVIEMGFYAQQTSMLERTNFSQKERVRAICEALHLPMGTTFSALSGGEQQRVYFGQLLAQRAQYYLIDELANHLDWKYEQQLLRFLQQQVQEGAGVLAAFHQLNSAAIYCDRIYVMKEGEIYASGTPKELYTPQLFKEVYQLETYILSHPTYQVPQVLVN